MLVIEDISFSYGKKPVITHLSTEIGKKEFFGIIGPNGSGKSTLVKLIIGILKASSGKILIDGTDIRRMPENQLSKEISYLPSGFDIYFPYTVEEFLSMGRFPYTGRYGKLEHKDREIIEATLVEFDIKNLRQRNLMELSEGEQQRVFLAQVVIQETSWILLDEPTSHLDIAHSYRIMDALKKLTSRGITVISVLHDLNLASEYCTKILLLGGGNIISAGPPDDVITYSNIEQAYKTKVLVYKNPYSQKPHVFGIPSSLLKESTRL